MAAYSLTTKIVLTSFLVLAGLGFSGLIVRWLVERLRVKADQVYWLKLANQGNCVCQYELSVKEPVPGLTFNFSVDGVPLAPVYEEVEETVVSEVETLVQSEPKAVAVASGSAPTKTQDLNADAALGVGKDVSVKSGVFASLLGTLGSILPGSLGSSVKGAAGGARKVQAGTAKAVQAPQSAQRKVDSLQKSGGRLGVKADDAQVAVVAKPKAGARQMRSAREQTEFSRTTREIVKTVKRTVEKVGVVQTVDLDPGEALLLALTIGKAGKRYPAGSFGYLVESQPVPLNKRLGSAPAAVKSGQVYFAPIARWRYWMPSLSVSLYLLIFALLAYFLFLFIWA